MIYKPLIETALILAMVTFSVQTAFTQTEAERDAEGNPVIDTARAQKIVDTEVFEGVKEGKFLISEMKGKIVVLDFWQTWCAPCLESFKGFQKAKEKWPDKIEILAASPDWADKERKIRRFIRKHDYEFTFVKAYDLEKELSLSSIPYKIIFAPDGSLIQSKSGSEGKEGEYEILAELINKWFDKTTAETLN